MKKTINFTEECKQAHETLKVLLTSAPVLIWPMHDRMFYLHVDASAVGAGAACIQLGDEGREHPVAYA